MTTFDEFVKFACANSPELAISTHLSNAVVSDLAIIYTKGCMSLNQQMLDLDDCVILKRTPNIASIQANTCRLRDIAYALNLIGLQLEARAGMPSDGSEVFAEMLRDAVTPATWKPIAIAENYKPLRMQRPDGTEFVGEVCAPAGWKVDGVLHRMCIGGETATHWREL